MERLLIMWKSQEGEVCALEDTFNALDLSTIPRHQIGWGEIEGRSGHLAMQGLAVE